MLPSRGGRRVLGGTEWLGQLAPGVGQASRNTGFKFEIKGQGGSHFPQNRHFSSRTLPNLAQPTASNRHHGLHLARSLRPCFPTGITTVVKPLSPGARQVRYQSTSQTGPFNTPLPPGDYGLPAEGLLPDGANEAQLEATGGAVGQWTSGYMKELGMDFGWGPSSTIQWLFEHLHMYDGLTIGGTIVATAVLIRLLTFPTVLAAQNNSSRLGAMIEITKPIQARQRKAALEGDNAESARARQELSKIYKDSGVQLWKSFLPMIQIPIGFGFWRLTRNMADLPVPGMENAGFWWFPNLVTYDPYFILPVATGLIQHLSMRMGGETATSTEASKKMRAIFVYGLPIMAPIFIGFAPAAVQLSFCTGATLSLCTTTALRQPLVRNFFNLPPIIRPKPTTTEPASPYQGTITVAGRVKDHPKNATPATPVQSGVGGLYQKLKPSSLKAGVGELGKTVSNFVGEAVPSAKQRQLTKADKLAKTKADGYEAKRAKEIQAEKVAYEKAQRGRAR